MHIKSLLLLTALASAHPSPHAHLHRHRNVHPNRAVGDIVTATINGKVVTWTNSFDGSPFVKAKKPETTTSATPTPTPSTTSTPAPETTSTTAAAASTTSSAAAASSTSSSSSASGEENGEGITEYTTFESYCASAKKRATAAQIAYTGNTGTRYGCNKLLVATEAVANKYDNLATFLGGKEDMQCLIWNKIGSDGGIDGFWGTDATTFTLKAGKTQYVAFDSNSQGGAACFSGDVSKTSWGEIAGNWFEFDFENSSNGGWSGYDASVIVAQEAGLSFPGLKICGAGTCSSISSSGVADNAYLAKDKDADGIGGKVQGPLTVTVDWSFE